MNGKMLYQKIACEPNDRRRYAVYVGDEYIGDARKPKGDYYWLFLRYGDDGIVSYKAWQRKDAVAAYLHEQVQP